MSRSSYLKRLAAKTRMERDESFEDSNVLTNQKDRDEAMESGLVNLTVSELLAKLKAGEVTHTDVVHAFARRSAKYGGPQGANAITAQFFDEAATIAASFADPNHLDGELLRGIPISVKDCIGKAGALQTGGLSCRCEEKFRSTENSVIVDVLQRAGAIVLERGNVSQAMMLPEAENNVFGRTSNPWDESRVPGGSSGGDAALVSMRCVPLALGSDVGGSIRIPAAYCGIVGFKPTPDRLSKVGCMLPRPNDVDGVKLAIPSVLGPLARTTDDCARFLQAVWCQYHFDRDPVVPPITFRENVYRDESPLRIGVFKTDNWFEPCKAAVRAVDEVVEQLKGAGHEVVSFEPPTTGWESYILYVGLMGADGNMNGFLHGLDGEALLPTYSKLKQASDIPNALRPILGRVLDKRRAVLVSGLRSGGLTARKHIQMLSSLMGLRKQWNKAFAEAEVDVLLHPALALPALRHGTSGDITGSVHLAFLANLLLWPAGTVPVTTIKENEQSYPTERLPVNQRDYWANKAAETMKGSAGLPVSVAVTAPQFKDEICLRLMATIEKLANFREEPKAYLRQQSS